MSTRPVALVTGGGARLGREMALELAAHGWDVALHYRRSKEQALAVVREIEAIGARAECFAADLMQERECKDLLPAAARHFGSLQAVVNNAALFEHDDVGSFGYAAMASHWRSNVGPAVLLARALHAHVIAGDGNGCVVNLLDQKLWNPNPDYLSYTLSKAALQMATTLLAQALAPQLRVCAVAPGVTLPSGPMSNADFDWAHRQTPLQRSSTPQDIARAVRFLLESPAITGTTLLVDGGQHLAAMPRDVMFMNTTVEKD